MFKMVICGNLTGKVEARDVSGGVRCATFTVAVNHWSNGSEKTEFVRCTAWRQVAERCEKYLDKGSKVVCLGKPSVHAWNGNDNSARAQIELSLDEITFCGRAKDAAEQTAEQPAEQPAEMTEDDDPGLPF